MAEPLAGGGVPGSRSKIVLGLLALAAALLLALGVQGTFAYWNDSATVTGGTFSSGTLDLTVDLQQGNPSYAMTMLAMPAMLPGESVSATVDIGNAGAADFTWIPTSTTGGLLGPALTVQLYVGTASVDDGTYPRQETCAGTPLTSGTTSTRLNRGAQKQTLCVLVSLPLATNDAFQGRTTGSVSIAIAATQALTAAP